MLLLLALYSISTLLLIGCSNLLAMVLMMESLSWLFSALLNRQAIKYLIIQSVFFMLMLIGMFWIKFLMITGLLMKMGVFPFHVWLLNILNKESKFNWSFFMTFHKLTPVLLLMKMFFENSLCLILISVVVGSSALILESSSFFFVLSFSSMIHTSWMVFSACMEILLYLMYFIVYSMLIFMFMWSLNMQMIFKMALNQHSVSLLLWLVLSGLPPFSIFWLKVMVLNLMIYQSYLMLYLLIFSSVLMMVSYYRLMQLTISSSKTMMKGHSLNFLFMIILVL